MPNIPSDELVAEEDFVWINGYACPPAPKVEPLRSLSAVLKLIQNKEDTRQVFEAVSTLAGNSGHRQFKRFTDTEYGRKVIETPVQAEKILSNREWLRTLPEGSFGRVYLDFMEGEDLTPDGLLSSAKEAGIDMTAETQFPAYQRLFLHQAVLHDVMHVLSGYGRDAIGELCNLAFTQGHSYNRGFSLIILLGAIAQKAEQPSQPLWAAIQQGRKMGRESNFVFGYDIEELLPMQLADVRRKLNILTPTIYNQIPDEIKANLLQPKVKETQAEREEKLAAAGAH